MLITRFPNTSNPNIMIEKEIDRRYGTCPFCGAKYNMQYDYNDHYTTRISYSYSTTLSGVQRRKVYSWYGYRSYIPTDYPGVYRYKFNLIALLKDVLSPKTKRMTWKIVSFMCNDCDAEWDSDPYPHYEMHDIGPTSLPFDFINDENIQYAITSKQEVEND